MLQYQDQEPDPRSHLQKLVDELVKQARKADVQDRNRAEAMRVLVSRPEWKVYLELLGPRIQNFADALMSPLAGMDAVLAQEYLKGAMSGLIIARDLPAIIIAAMSEISRPADDDDGDGQ